MKYFLDTNIISYIIKGKYPKLLKVLFKVFFILHTVSNLVIKSIRL